MSHPNTRLARWLNPDPKKTLLVACWILLILWLIWWGVSFHCQELQAGKHLWFPPSYTGMGVDFYRHIDPPVRIWWNGGDPYAQKLGDKAGFFPYPPLVLHLFFWINVMNSRTALMVWLGVMTMILVVAAREAGRWRHHLDLTEIPLPTTIAFTLFSTPVLFAMDRGQCDALSLLFILVALPLLKHSSKGAQYAAGALLCLAPWVKVYPGLILIGLLGLRRWRALASFVVVSITIAFSDLNELQRFLINNEMHIQWALNVALLNSGAPMPWNHSLYLSLASLWLATKFSWLGLFSGKLLAAMLLIPPLVWVTYHVYSCPGRDKLTYPYLLWLVALATFVPPVSNDYNLFFLPLAVLAVWDRRDPLLVQVALALLLIWWQPIGMSIKGMPLLVIKLLSLGAIAVCLVERTFEQSRIFADNE